MDAIRVYVGGLGESVSSDDLNKIFSATGFVRGVDIVRTKGRSFAYIDFSPSSANSLPKLFSTYNGCVWKGGRLRLEKAKEHYLARLRREWEEEAAGANSTPADNSGAEASIRLAEKPKKDSETAKEQLKLYFPKLRKVKTLPFSGTGKHKYSFQRVEALAMPTNFCSCEEHFTPERTQQNDVDSLESQDGGINAEELNMNIVMNKLFQKESSSKAANTEAVYEDETMKPLTLSQTGHNEADNEADEDNLITNVVSSKKSGWSLPESQKHKTVPRKQKSTSSETNGPGDNNIMNASKEQKRMADPSKKRKSIDNERSRRKQLLPIETDSIDPPQADSDSQNTKVVAEAGIQCSRSNISWSQRSSWKALIADGENASFSVSNFLSGSASTTGEHPPREGLDDPNPKWRNNLKSTRQLKFQTKSGHQHSVAEKGEDLLINMNAVKSEVDGPAFSDPRVNEVVNHMKRSLHENDTKQITTKTDGLTAYPVADTTDGEIPLIVSNEPETDTTVSGLYACTTAKEEESKHSSVSLAKSVDSERQSMDGKEFVEEKMTIEVRDESKNAQRDRAERSLNNPGRGSAWLHKSSWTQLVGENNGSFSITQLLPSLNHEKAELAGPSNIHVKDHSTFVGSMVTEKASESEFSEHCPQAIEGSVQQSISEKNQQTVEGSAGISTSAVSETHNPVPKAFGEKILVGNTCSFMRNAASLKDWAAAKKALSASRKRKKAED